MNKDDSTPFAPTSQPPPPRILRIKRKRGQDPLQALILEDTRSIKRSKPSTPITSPVATPRSQTPLQQHHQQQHQLQHQLLADRSNIDNERLNYMFKLAKTEFGNDAELDESVLHTILAEAASTAAIPQNEGEEGNTKQNQDIKRRFIIQPDETRRQSAFDYEGAADANIPDQLFNMVEDLVSKGDDKGKTKRKRRGYTGGSHVDEKSVEEPVSRDTIIQNTIDSNEDDENQYVYDVYQLADAEPLTTANHPLAQIGYIRFFNDDDSDSNSNVFDSAQQDADDLKKPSVLTDDEDSNAESFYQNDYPSDEDAEGLQELNSFEDEFDKLNIGDDDGGDSAAHEAAEYVAHDGIGWNGEEYFDYVEVERFMGLDDADDEDEEDYDGNELKRNQFFKSDAEDPLALHRDKIFGKLEKMINNDDFRGN